MNDASLAAERAALISETGEGPFGTLIRMGPHSLRADEPTTAGGLDGGPGPYDLLMASLGACTTMTVRMYANRKGLKLERVEARVQQVARRSAGAPQDVFEREIELVGELTDEERARLLTIAEHCPVSRTLAGGSAIRTYLAGGLDGEGD
jgi:putative redox protein